MNSRRLLALSRAFTSRVLGGLPVPSSGLWKQAQQGLRSAASTAVSRGPDARSERPARGHGQPRPTQDPDSPARQLPCRTGLPLKAFFTDSEGRGGRLGKTVRLCFSMA